MARVIFWYPLILRLTEASHTLSLASIVIYHSLRRCCARIFHIVCSWVWLTYFISERIERIRMSIVHCFQWCFEKITSVWLLFVYWLQLCIPYKCSWITQISFTNKISCSCLSRLLNEFLLEYHSRNRLVILYVCDIGIWMREKWVYRNWPRKCEY